MIRKLLLGLLFTGLATPSFAGFSMMCSGPEGITANLPLEVVDVGAWAVSCEGG